MNGPIVKKLSDAHLKVLRGGGCKKTRRTARTWRKSDKRSTARCRKTTHRRTVKTVKVCLPQILLG